MNILTAQKISVCYGQHSVLSHVDLEVKPGQFIGLLGANGSGKSTLLRTIMGFIKPTNGHVRIHGRPIQKYSIKQLAQTVAYVPQDTYVDFDFSVKQLVEMGRHPYLHRFASAVKHQTKVKEALDITQLSHLQDRSVLELSGGQRQKVFIAKALAQDPDLFVLDEPISALDIRHQLDVLELINAVTKRGSAAIAAIHDLNLAARFCDDIVLLADGCVLAAGKPEEVLTEEYIRQAYGVQSMIREDTELGTVQVTATHTDINEMKIDQRGRRDAYEIA